jgi:hypothetical protein
MCAPFANLLELSRRIDDLNRLIDFSRGTLNERSRGTGVI